MTITTLSIRAFDEDAGRARRAAADGPVFITDRGEPAHVLLTIEEYRRLAGQRLDVLDALGQPSGVEDVAIEFPSARDLARGAELA